MKKNYKMLLNKLYGNYYTRIVHKFSKQTKNISCTILIEVKTKKNTLQYSTYSVQNILFNYNKKKKTFIHQKS